MATSLLLPSRSTILSTALQEIQDQLPGASTATGGAYAIIANVVATVCWPVYQPIAFLADQIFPSSASPEFLKRHGDLYKIPRQGANAANGWLKITGTVGSVQGLGTTFTDPTGQKYTFTSAGTITTPGWASTTILASSSRTPDRFQVVTTGGMAVGDALTIGGSTFLIRDLPGSNVVIIWGRIPIIIFNGQATINGLTVAAGTAAAISWTADFTGTAGNLPLDSVVTIDSPGAGVDATARVIFAADGIEAQKDADWASHMETIRAEYPAGGNRAQLAFWSLGYLTKQDRDEGRVGTYALGTDRTFVWPLFRGRGTADITPQGAPGARHLSLGRRTEIQERIYPATPTPSNPGLVAMGADIAVTDFTDLVQDISITVYGSNGYQPDFDTSGPYLTQAGTTTTRLLLVPNPLLRMHIDDRVCFMSAGRLVQVRILNVFATGIDIDTTLDVAPPNNTQVYSGSDLIIPIKESLDAMFAALGPGDTTPPSRWPAPTSDLPAELQLPLIDKYVMSVPGVKTLTITTPATAIIPAAKQQIVQGSYVISHRAV
jgi:uncharacterized phage protein gp47/JayE